MMYIKGMQGWLFVLAFALAGMPNDVEGVKLVTTGEVRKIDAKNQTFQFKFRLDEPQFNRAVRPYPPGGGRRGGVYGRRGRRGYPPPVQVDDDKEVKVFISEGTRFKGPAQTLRFSDLRVGDRITVTAMRKGRGDDLEAVAVVRN
jgi:hypothetical protein